MYIRCRRRTLRDTPCKPLDDEIARRFAGRTSGDTVRFAASLTGSRVYNERDAIQRTCVGRKAFLPLFHSRYGVKNFSSGSTTAGTSTWLGNAQPTGGERERRGSRVRLSVRLFVRLSVTTALLARTNASWFPLSLTASLSLSHSFVRPFRIFLSPFLFFSVPLLSFYYSVSVSLAVPLSASLALSRCLGLSFPPSVAPSLLSFYLSFGENSARTHPVHRSFSPFLPIVSLFSLVTHRYVDARIEDRERAHQGNGPFLPLARTSSAKDVAAGARGDDVHTRDESQGESRDYARWPGSTVGLMIDRLLSRRRAG